MGLALVFAVALCAGPVGAIDPNASAKAFAAALYRAYVHGSGPDITGHGASAVFSPRLLRLIRKDQASTPAGEVGALDGDPICDCQDPSGLRLARLDVTSSGPGRAVARVTLSFPDGRRRLRLDLEEGQAGWRVSDVHTADMPSLLGLLQSTSRGHAR